MRPPASRPKRGFVTRECEMDGRYGTSGGTKFMTRRGWCLGLPGKRSSRALSAPPRPIPRNNISRVRCSHTAPQKFAHYLFANVTRRTCLRTAPICQDASFWPLRRHRNDPLGARSVARLPAAGRDQLEEVLRRRRARGVGAQAPRAPGLAASLLSRPQGSPQSRAARRDAPGTRGSDEPQDAIGRGAAAITFLPAMRSDRASRYEGDLLHACHFVFGRLAKA